MIYDIDIIASETEFRDGIIVVPTGLLEEFFGVTRKTLQTWAQKGCPKLARGKWDFVGVLRWRGVLPRRK